MKLSSLLLATTLAIPFAPLPASAILITFESDQGYLTDGGTGNNGNLKGQPGGATGTTAWSNTIDAARLRVADDGKGGQWLVANNSDGASNYYTFAPSADDLGEAFDPDSSRIAFSFDYTLLQRGPQMGIAYFRVGLNNGNMVRIAFYSDGKINFNSGSSSSFAKNADGSSDFAAAANVTYQIAGVIDYGSNSYTLNINGVSQQIGGSTELAFIDPNKPSTDINLIVINPTNDWWRPYAFDNLSYTAVPEGSQTVLLGIAGALAWFSSRRFLKPSSQRLAKTNSQ